MVGGIPMLLDSVQAIRFVAERLDLLTERMVFLGGATLGLLVTERGAAPPRPTKDVDLVVEITMLEYLNNSFRSRVAQPGLSGNARRRRDLPVGNRRNQSGHHAHHAWDSRPQQSLVSGRGCSGTALPVSRRTEYPTSILSLLPGDQARGLRESWPRRLSQS
jgi:hypothetical protein